MPVTKANSKYVIGGESEGKREGQREESIVIFSEFYL